MYGSDKRNSIEGCVFWRVARSEEVMSKYDRSSVELLVGASVVNVQLIKKSNDPKYYTKFVPFFVSIWYIVFTLLFTYTRIKEN